MREFKRNKLRTSPKINLALSSFEGNFLSHAHVTVLRAVSDTKNPSVVGVTERWALGGAGIEASFSYRNRWWVFLPKIYQWTYITARASHIRCLSIALKLGTTVPGGIQATFPYLINIASRNQRVYINKWTSSPGAGARGSMTCGVTAIAQFEHMNNNNTWKMKKGAAAILFVFASSTKNMNSKPIVQWKLSQRATGSKITNNMSCSPTGIRRQ